MEFLHSLLKPWGSHTALPQGHINLGGHFGTTRGDKRPTSGHFGPTVGHFGSKEGSPGSLKSHFGSFGSPLELLVGHLRLQG